MSTPSDGRTSVASLHTFLRGVPEVRILACEPDGTTLRTDRDAVELIGAAHQHGAGLILIPVERLDGGFFRLRTRVAGEIIQKFVTYGLRVAFVGDISAYIAESPTFRDFVYEANRGDQVWFVADIQELEARLNRGAPS